MRHLLLLILLVLLVLLVFLLRRFLGSFLVILNRSIIHVCNGRFFIVLISWCLFVREIDRLDLIEPNLSGK